MEVASYLSTIAAQFTSLFSYFFQEFPTVSTPALQNCEILFRSGTEYYDFFNL